jgi:hypothetical protein
MRRSTIALAWAALLVVAGPLAANAQATNPPTHPCNQHQDQASCAADSACQWNPKKNRCHRVPPPQQ